jgi:uroporphyrinogen decarboxylase
MLTSRERVLNAIEHRPFDKIPHDLGGVVSSISKIAYERYLSYLGIDYPEIIVSDRIQQLARIDEKLLSKFNIDTRHINLDTRGKYSESENNNQFKDIYGISYSKVGTERYPTLYYEITDYPLSTATLKNIDNYNWPSPADSWFKGKEKLAKQHYSNDKAVIADPTSGGILEQSIWLRGFEQFLLDLYNDIDLVHYLLDKNLEIQLNIWERYLDEIGEWTSIVFYGDDYGAQDRELLKPEMWRELIKPRLRKLISTIKADYSHIKLMLHSCGSIYSIIPDLIECGVDILNPIQPLANNMNPTTLKEVFGKKICFHGGIDIQVLLPRESPKTVEREVKKTLEILAGDKTGYIFATAHNILADVPAENIHALFKAISEYTF